MSLLQLGPYPIEREVGRGGMGVVYLGRDTRLGRPVAIKVLPDAFARDPERLARFEREARMLASLTHPNIAGIYGLEEADGRRFLALEYVEGETLAERLRRGPLPLDEAIDVCRQIASALEAAHEAGIVHRDLKPGNVKRTPSGDVKVLDFGLAKGGAGSADSISDLTHSPTIAIAATGAGVILGTAAYMSPEQARGRPVDRRTDIWSFGCVLYECLTGEQAFAGETVSDMIARILQGEPDVAKLPAATPERLRALLARCLEKDAKRRLRDIGEARIELEALAGGATSSSGLRAAPATAAPGQRRSARVEIGIAIGGAILAAVAGVIATRMLDRTPEPPALRFTVQSPPGTETNLEPNDLALSADGTRLALVAVDSTGAVSLWVRPLDAFEARPLPGTRGATQPFWSPDGRQIAFFADGKLKRMRLDGGQPEVVCDAPSPRGAVWSAHGDILLAPHSAGPIMRVRATGGAPTAASVVDTAAGETSHRWPRLLPDGVHFTYAAIPARENRFSCWIGSTERPSERTALMQTQSAPVFAPPSHLIFQNNDALQAQRFDPRSRRLDGEPVTIGVRPVTTTLSGAPGFSVSATGTLAWLSEGDLSTRLAWYSREGREIKRLDTPVDRWSFTTISDDGGRAVLEQDVSGGTDLWVLDLVRETMTRLTFGAGLSTGGVFTPDGRRVAFASNREGPRQVYSRPVDGSGQDEVIYRSPNSFKYPMDYFAGGARLLVHEVRPGSGWDVLEVDVATGQATPVFASPFDEQYAFLSPDERWVVYQSNESGSPQTWVCAWPGLDHKRLVTRASTAVALWTLEGRELIVFRPDGMIQAVAVTRDGAELEFGPPQELWRTGREFRFVTPDPSGRRFLAAVNARPTDGGISIDTRWRDQLKK